MKHNLKQDLKLVLLILLGFLVGIVTTLFCVRVFEDAWFNNSLPYELGAFPSPDSTHNVKVVADADPTWPFGPQSVHIEFDEFLSTKSIAIDTDGAEFEDFEVEWDGGTAFVTLDASPNEQLTYEATFYEDSVSVSFFASHCRAR